MKFMEIFNELEKVLRVMFILRLTTKRDCFVFFFSFCFLFSPLILKQNRDVAIKRMQLTPQNVDQMATEVGIMRECGKHPHIVQYIDCFMVQVRIIMQNIYFYILIFEHTYTPPLIKNISNKEIQLFFPTKHKTITNKEEKGCLLVVMEYMANGPLTGVFLSSFCFLCSKRKKLTLG